MIFDRNHGVDLTGERVPGATTLIVVHAFAYGGLALVFWPVPLVATVFALLLVGVSVVDMQRFEIPDTFSALLVVTGLVWLWVSDGPWMDRIAASVGFALLLYGVGGLYLRFRGHAGLGFGDVKLAAGLGLWLGVDDSVWTLQVASLSGIVVLLALLAMRRTSLHQMSSSGVAFGPFLCLSAWAVWLQGNTG